MKKIFFLILIFAYQTYSQSIDTFFPVKLKDNAEQAISKLTKSFGFKFENYNQDHDCVTFSGGVFQNKFLRKTEIYFDSYGKVQNIFLTIENIKDFIDGGTSDFFDIYKIIQKKYGDPTTTKKDKSFHYEWELKKKYIILVKDNPDDSSVNVAFEVLK